MSCAACLGPRRSNAFLVRKPSPLPAEMAAPALALAALSIAGTVLAPKRQEAEQLEALWSVGRAGRKKPHRRCWPQRGGCRSRAGGQASKPTTHWPNLLHPARSSRLPGSCLAPGRDGPSVAQPEVVGAMMLLDT